MCMLRVDIFYWRGWCISLLLNIEYCAFCVNIVDVLITSYYNQVMFYVHFLSRLVTKKKMFSFDRETVSCFSLSRVSPSCSCQFSKRCAITWLAGCLRGWLLPQLLLCLYFLLMVSFILFFVSYRKTESYVRQFNHASGIIIIMYIYHALIAVLSAFHRRTCIVLLTLR